MDPRDARPLIAGAIEEDLTLYATGAPPGELPGLYDRVSRHYQGLGIAILLVTMVLRTEISVIELVHVLAER